MNVAIAAAQDAGIDTALAGILASLVALLAGKLIKWLDDRSVKRAERDEKIAEESIEVGVHEAWEQAGKQLKRKALEQAEKTLAKANEGKQRSDPDYDYGLGTRGKLNETDKLRLRQIATATAERIAARRGVDLRKVLGAGAVIGSLIRKIVDRRKRDA